VDFFYTTYAGPLNPVYFLIIPSLIALALTAFTLLYSEFERHKNKTGKSNIQTPPSDRLNESGLCP
jgi:hypothetical protein